MEAASHPDARRLAPDALVLGALLLTLVWLAISPALWLTVLANTVAAGVLARRTVVRHRRTSDRWRELSIDRARLERHEARTDAGDPPVRIARRLHRRTRRLAAKADWYEIVSIRWRAPSPDDGGATRELEVERHELVRLLDALDDEASLREQASVLARHELGLPAASLSDVAGRARSARLTLENHLED